MQNTVLIFATLLVLIFVFYLLIPELCLHFLGLGAWKRQYTPGVTLTFDDGPDPRYTPRLLELLAKQKITACFFLVAEKAIQHPELVRQIRDAGHIIGSHGYYHRHAWFLSPWKTWNLWNKSIVELQKITYQQPQYVRGPWGGVNLAFFLWCRINKKRIIVWTTDGMDWESPRTPAEILQRVFRKTSEGTIVLLHDSGGAPGAPENTLASLEELCLKIRTELNLPIVPLSFPDWSFLRRLAFRLWEKWEHYYAKKNGVHRLDEHNLFRLARTHYHGPDLYTDDGTLLATKGDTVGELHLDNIRLRVAGTDMQKIGFRILKQIRLSLPILARYISTNPNYKDLKVFIGITMINRGVKGLGFTVQEYPNRNGFVIGLLQKVIMRIYHPAGNKRDIDKLGDKPKLIWISTETILERYGDKRKM